MNTEYIMIVILFISLVILSVRFYIKNRKYLKIKDIELETKRILEESNRQMEKAKTDTKKEIEQLINVAQKEIDKLKQDARYERDKLLEETNEELLREKLILRFRKALSAKYDNELLIRNEKLLDLELTLMNKELDIKKYEETIWGKYEDIEILNNKIEQLETEKLELELDIYMTECGAYKMHYNFITSEEYKDRFKKVRYEQKRMISLKNACMSEAEWEVNGNKRKGKKMINRNVQMMLRAFNGESEALIANVTYKNIISMENKLYKAFRKINELNEDLQCKIVDEYYDLKRQELRLVYEYQEKKYLEKEEQRIIKQQIKEEEKAQREFVRQLLRIEKEEIRYQKALEEARKEVKKASKERVDILSKRISELEYKLKEAQGNKRAISQAQITKSGYIYIISNIGSFGENIYKIGMTRRLEPYDRIKELNGPSVPFVFDVHAMIFSQNAPQLELMLHNQLAYAKLNRINKRKEFFKIDLKTIEGCVRENSDSKVEFIYEHEAKEYRMSEKLKIEEKAV